MCWDLFAPTPEPGVGYETVVGLTAVHLDQLVNLSNMQYRDIPTEWGKLNLRPIRKEN